jgi:hypothetical protein
MHWEVLMVVALPFNIPRISFSGQAMMQAPVMMQLFGSTTGCKETGSWRPSFFALAIFASTFLDPLLSFLKYIRSTIRQSKKARPYTIIFSKANSML